MPIGQYGPSFRRSYARSPCFVAVAAGSSIARAHVLTCCVCVCCSCSRSLGLPDDLFYPAPWDLQADMTSCYAQFGTVPRPNWIAQQFGATAQDWASATNIVFSNGDLDPWSGGGVKQNLSATVIAIPVVGGAHHFDLRGANPADTPGVIWARQQEVAWIRTFLQNPSPANPPQVIVECENQSLLKAAVILVCVFCTLVATILAFLLYRFCVAASPVSENNSVPAQQEGQVNTVAAGGYRSLHDPVDASSGVRLTVR